MENVYHLLNRGVEKRKVFINNVDYIRFIHNLKDFNDKDNAHQSYSRRRTNNTHLTDVARPSDELVDMLCWALMPNHPHIMAIEKDIGNISIFSKKIFGGYTKYFNEHNNRSGVLFQGRSKIIQVVRNAHFLYLPFYIHLNPLGLMQPNWKEDGVKNIDKAMEFLEQYRWSNYRDIISTGNGEFADASNKKLFFEMFQTNPQKYKKDLRGWIKDGGYREDFNQFE